MHFFLSLWMKSWQLLRVYFKQSQWFLERWKTHEGHNEKQAENLTAGQGETRVIKNTASSSGRQAGRQGEVPFTAHRHARASHYAAVTGPAQNSELFPAELPSPCWWPMLHIPCPAHPDAAGGRRWQSWQKKGAGDTHSSTKARSITKTLVPKPKISCLRRM